MEQTQSVSATQGIAQMTAAGTAGAGKSRTAQGGLFAALLALLSANNGGKQALHPDGSQSGTKTTASHGFAPSGKGEISPANGRKHRRAGNEAEVHVNGGHARDKKDTRKHADFAPGEVIATAPAQHTSPLKQARQARLAPSHNATDTNRQTTAHAKQPAHAAGKAMPDGQRQNAQEAPEFAARNQTQTPETTRIAATMPTAAPRDGIPAAELRSGMLPKTGKTVASGHASDHRNANTDDLPHEATPGTGSNTEKTVRNEAATETALQAAARDTNPAAPRMMQALQTQAASAPEPLRQPERQPTGRKEHGRNSRTINARAADTASSHEPPRAGTPTAFDALQVRNTAFQAHASRFRNPPHEQDRHITRLAHAPATGAPQAANISAVETAMNAASATTSSPHAVAQPSASGSSVAPMPQTHDGPSRMFGPMRALEAVQQIAHSASQGHSRLDIQLEPAHLGKVHVSLQTDAAKQLIVHITAEQPAAQQAIQQHLPQLRLALESQGMQPGDFSLNAGMGGEGQGQWQGAWQNDGNTGAPGNRHDSPVATSAPAAANREADATPRHPAGRLSIRI